MFRTTQEYYLGHLRSICARDETPTSLVEGKSLNEHAYYVRHRLSQKRKLLWHHINTLQCYAWNLCEIYDFTCCSEDSKNTFPINVSLRIMELYLLMPRVFIITMILIKL